MKFDLYEEQLKRELMDAEIKSLIMVWTSVTVSLCYCYLIVSKLRKGKTRFVSLLPIFYLFIILPFHLSSLHFSGLTAFLIAWLANFKLLLFSLGLGPLSSDPPPSFLQFILISCLPIKIKPDPSPLQIKKQITQTPLSSVIKALFIALMVYIYDYGEYIHPNIILVVKGWHMYLFLEITLAMVAVPAQALFGLVIEPQFNKPYLSTSLQDFWGKRWNLMVTSILRPTVYEPLWRVSEPVVGKAKASLVAVVGTFVVSGLLHELIFYYITRVNPTGEVTCFFVVHGICTALEIAVKKEWPGRWGGLHPVISGGLTQGFVLITAYWLFAPQLIRNGVDWRGLREYSDLVEFVTGWLPYYGK